MTPQNAEMAKIQFRTHADYLYAAVSGQQDSLEISIEFWRRCIDECKMRGLEKLLVVENFPNQLSTHETYALIGDIRRMLTSPLKIAFVDSKSDQAELNMFGETVATNRGIAGKVFKRLEDAEKWLQAAPPKLDWQL